MDGIIFTFSAPFVTNELFLYRLKISENLENLREKYIGSKWVNFDNMDRMCKNFLQIFSDPSCIEK